MPINVVFKGPFKSAKRAAARAGIPVSSCKQVSAHFAEVQCKAPCNALTKIQRAYKRISIKPGRGASPGDLLLFSLGTCATSELRGASRRRRRRRR